MALTVSQVQVYNSLRVFSFPLTSYLFSSDRRLRKLYFRKPLNGNEKLMKKLNLQLTVEENSSPCLKFLTEITNENTRTDRRGFEMFCHRKLPS